VARLAIGLPRTHRYVGVAAEPIELSGSASGRSWHAFARADGEPVAAIIHDSILDEDPELVDAAGSAAVLALENRRLDHTLRRSRQDLDESHARLVAAVAEEGRRIERDRHDGAQQPLLASRHPLRLARARA